MLARMRAPVVAVFVAVVVAVILFAPRASAQTAAPSPSLQLGPPAPHGLIQHEGAAATQPMEDPNDPPRVEASTVEFLSNRFRAHEPIYFVAGPLNPNSKFQVSLKYQLFSDTGDIARLFQPASDFYVAYSQTSFWDIGGDSSPFFDSSYRPEFLYQLDPLEAEWLPGMTRFDFQAGLRHESNGKAGADSRSMNIAYVSPIFTFGDAGDARNRNDGAAVGFFVAFAPRVWTYLTDNDDNPDIYRYRGYGDIRLVAGWRGGFQAAFTGRIGNDFDKGSLQVDLTYPLERLAIRDLGMYLHGQFFTGYGESLLEYDESNTSFRLGVSLVR